MKMFQKRVIFSMVVISVLLLSICTGAKGQLMRPSFPEDKAIEFTLEDLGGNEYKLEEVLKSKKAVLVFFATWCPSCVREVKDIKKFYEENKDEVEVISINVQESSEKVAKFIKRKKVTYPVVLDKEGRIARLYGVKGIPALIAVDQDKTILYKGHSVEEMANEVDFSVVPKGAEGSEDMISFEESAAVRESGE